MHINLGTTALLSLLLLSGPGRADQGKVIPISPEDKKELALLGEGVVGKALPARPITDPEKYLNLGSGTWEFKIVSGKKKGKTQAESYSKLADRSWQRKIGDEYIEFIAIGTDQSYTKTAETASEFGYRATFEPGIHEATGLKPGESITIESKLRVSSEKDLTKTKYSGTMKGTLTYAGAYEVTTPAGTFETVLIKTALKIHVGPAQVEDTQYTFFAPGVGKVAEVEAQRIAAVLIYHSHSDTAKVLVKYPARTR
jgi:hypothetical protein